MCPNYVHDPPNRRYDTSFYRQSVRKTTSLVLCYCYFCCADTLSTQSPPPLCDFKEWIDKEIDPNVKQAVEFMSRIDRESRERRAEEREYEKIQERRRVELRARLDAVDRRLAAERAAEREADRERKRERARRAKAAGQDAINKGKYPRCTQ
jgi:hypothetical protein